MCYFHYVCVCRQLDAAPVAMPSSITLLNHPFRNSSAFNCALFGLLLVLAFFAHPLQRDSASSFVSTVHVSCVLSLENARWNLFFGLPHRAFFRCYETSEYESCRVHYVSLCLWCIRSWAPGFVSSFWKGSLVLLNFSHARFCNFLHFQARAFDTPPCCCLKKTPLSTWRE